MFGKKSQQSPDLTTPESVEKSQKVYDRIAAGTCKDAKTELDSTHGVTPKKKR
ncbi:hypothetical protein AB0L42_14655 [Streptomyces sp. NPDC052287]|uniref:hypothetical protein n=1 Tax=Streptomyces sp. NPDC052287 TaxID=3154950 RepID=UPI00342E7E94